MKAQQPHKNTIQLVALATTAAPSTLQNIMFWNIDGTAKHLFIAAVNCVTIFFRFNKSLLWITSLFPPWRCLVFLSVTSVGYIVDKRSPISATAVLSSYLSTQECICRIVLASSASASRGTKQRRQLHFQFALLVYEFTTSVRL